MNTGTCLAAIGAGITVAISSCADPATPAPDLTQVSPQLLASPAATKTPPIEILTHSDELYGFTFDYPAAWQLDQVSLGQRAPAAYQLTSWSHQPGMVATVPDGASIMNIGIQLWEPNGDLDAYVAQRKTAWEATGVAITRSEETVLANGVRAVAGAIRNPEGGEGYFLFTTIGDDYLFATGEGDMELVELVAKSIR